MKIKSEEEEEIEERKSDDAAPPLPQPSPVVIPIRKGRKGSKWQASGFITKVGDQISSYTAESGVTYRHGGWYLLFLEWWAVFPQLRSYSHSLMLYTDTEVDVCCLKE